MDIPSPGFLFAFAGASELIPFCASSYLRWNFPAGTSELFLLLRQLGSPLGFAIPGDSFSEIPPCFPPSGFILLICSWGTTFTLLGVYYYSPFLGNYINHKITDCLRSP